MQTPKPRRKLRLWLARLALLTVTAMLGLGLLEILVRVFMPYYNPGYQILLRRNDEGVVLGIPNTTTLQRSHKGDSQMTVRLNQHGFRDRKDYLEGTTNDVFISGDSYSFGWSVEEDERYSNVLEKQLGIRCYNVAIPEDIRGYARTLRYVEKHGARVRNVIIGLCMENDLWDYKSITNTHIVFQSQLKRTLRQETAGWFRDRSALWNCLSHTLQKFSGIRRFFEKIGISRNIDELTHKNLATPEVLESSRDELLSYATNYNSVVVIIPSRALWLGNNVERERQAHDQITSMLGKAGLKVVDMRPVFEATGNPTAYYFKNDPHWNADGHALVGKTLAEFISRDEAWKAVRPPSKSKPAATP